MAMLSGGKHPAENLPNTAFYGTWGVAMYLKHNQIMGANIPMLLIEDNMYVNGEATTQPGHVLDPVNGPLVEYV